MSYGRAINGRGNQFCLLMPGMMTVREHVSLVWSWVILGKLKDFFVWEIRALDSCFQQLLNFSNCWDSKVKVPTGPPHLCPSPPGWGALFYPPLPPTDSYTPSLLPQSLHTCSSLPWMLWPPLNILISHFLGFVLKYHLLREASPINICKITHMLKRRETSHTAVLILCRDDE